MSIGYSNMPDGAWSSNYDDVRPRTIRCSKKVFKWKPDYTGYPAPMRNCYNEATYIVGDATLCTRHTDKEFRTKENKDKLKLMRAL